jgi:ATP-dependent helicase/nuclease subunit B
MVVEELWQELKDAEFEPVGFEVAFGGADGLPPIAIPNKSMNAILRGFIDRVDVWQTAGSSYYRVVDYKTGKKDFDYCDVFNGVGLQMLLYLFALRSSGDASLGNHPVPAGVQYFPARAPVMAADGLLSPEEAGAAREKVWKRKGLLLSEESVLEAMEQGKPKRLSITKKDGVIGGDVATSQQLQILKKYVFSLLSKMVDEIASGNVSPNPYTRGSSHSACAFCPYGAICHAVSVEERRNYKTMTAERFWDEVEKEVLKFGGTTDCATEDCGN